MKAPLPPALPTPSILTQPLRPAGSISSMMIPPQINSYNNTYGGIAEVSKKRSLVVMNALTKGAPVDEQAEKQADKVKEDAATIYAMKHL